MMIDRRALLGCLGSAMIPNPGAALSLTVLADGPPLGPWQKGDSPVLVAPSGAGWLPENIVFDPVGRKYWMVFSNFGDPFIGLANSTDMIEWTVVSAMFFPAPGRGAAPHLLLNDGIWYLYYSRFLDDGDIALFVSTSSAPDGVYGNETLLLAPVPGTWEAHRVMESYVFQDDDGTWLMFYMGDAGGVPLGTPSLEQIGLARAAAPGGPFIRSPLNPVIRFGAPGSFDAGVVADPHVVKFGGIYYIFYSTGPVVPIPWTTALVTSADLVTFTKQGVVLPFGDEGAFDGFAAVRGAITRVGDIYYWPYAGYNGVNWSGGMAVAPAKGILR